MKLKVGTLVGEKLWGIPSTDQQRQAAVDGVNSGDFHGIVMTDQVGGTGHNIVGANHIIFLGSLYQPTGEKQAIGKKRCWFANDSAHRTRGTAPNPEGVHTGRQRIYRRSNGLCCKAMERGRREENGRAVY